MNTTRTLTLSTERTVLLRLQPPPAVPIASPEIRSERLFALLERMRTSHLFSERMIIEINSWERDLQLEFSERLSPTTLLQPDEEIALALCDLLCRVLHPVIDDSVEGSQEEIALLAFEEELRELVAATLPEGQSIDPFIENYESLIPHEEQLFNLMEEIQALFQQQMEELYGRANEINDELRVRTLAVRERLRLLNREQQEEMRALQNPLIELATSTDALYNSLETLLRDERRQGERIEAERVRHLALLGRCQLQLQRLKK